MVVDQFALDLLGRGEVVVHGGGVEDPVGEAAVVGGAVAVAGEDGAHLGPGEGAVEEGHVLGGALAGSDDDKAGGVRAVQGRHAREEFRGVPDLVGAVHALRHLRAQAGADDQVARPVDHQLGAGAGGDVQVLDHSVAHDGAYGDDLAAVGDHVVDLGGGPLEVVVELHAQREEVLVVDEVDQTAAALEVAEEAVFARRVAQCHQVLEEGHLHRGVVDEHAAVPAEARLLLEEVGGDRLLRSDTGVVLAECDGHGHVRGAEADADEVVDQRRIIGKIL